MTIRYYFENIFWKITNYSNMANLIKYEIRDKTSVEHFDRNFVS